MIRTLALLCLVAASASALWGIFDGLTGEAWKPAHLVKFEYAMTGVGKTSFIPVPKTLAEAADMGWVEMPRPAGGPKDYESLTMWCRSETDCGACPLFDDTGNTMGMQTAIQKDLFTDNIYDMNELGYLDWTVEASDGTTTDYFVMCIFYGSPEYLQLDAETRMAQHDKSKLVQDETVHVMASKNRVLPISTDCTKMADYDYTEQACMPWMGHHFYYKMSKDLVCTLDDLVQWFPLCYHNKMVGIGQYAIGKKTIPEHGTNYNEAPPQAAVKMIVNKGPEWFYDYAATPGISTMHIYFIKSPMAMTCMLE